MCAYSIKIEHCNSIEKASILISEGVLNIKYGPNGLGKSTISKAISSSVEENGSLESLRPFKYRGLVGIGNPVVHGTEDIKSVLVFDDAFVSQFVFQRDEVLKNSFDIFIKTDTFDSAMQEIESLLAGIKSSFDGNEALSSTISDLKEVRDAFGVTKSGSISKSSKAYKAFGSGNKIENIPSRLKPYEGFIKSDAPATWIAWQSQGNGFLDLSDNCPYCASDLMDSEKKDTAKQVAIEYNSKNIEHLNAIQAVINRLGRYFEESCRDILDKITKSKLELSPEETVFLSNLRGEVETLISKLEGLRSISFFALRDVEKIEDEITRLKIDLSLLAKLNSEDTIKIVDPINNKLQELVNRVGELKCKINTHKKQIEKSISENNKSINGFLRSAGYKYIVSIKPEADSYKMKLEHQDHNEHIESAAKHLSYGEKNAFALVLFMHKVISDKPTLAILDDPVSSFDKTKKFAILNELFRGKASLRDTTVLMLTHDIEPAIDVIRSVKGLFQKSKPTAFFLSSRDGVVTETEIKSEDIQTFSKICSDNVKSISDEVIKCIYLRRNYEIVNDFGEAYNYLANLLHARQLPIIKTDSGDVAMTPEEISRAETDIKGHIPNFEYNSILSIINNKAEMIRRFKDAEAGYDKVQLFRIYKKFHIPDDGKDSVLTKFVNESFHIENEYLMQLNPHKFDNVPEYLVKECERIISAA